MKGYLTYNRLINILTVEFYHQDWTNQSLDYIKEKYDRIFSSLPDRVYSLNEVVIWKGTFTICQAEHNDFYKKKTEFKNRWHIKTLSPDQTLMLFAISHFTQGIRKPNGLNKSYCDLYTDYDYINEYSQLWGLHELLKQKIEGYDISYSSELAIYKRVSVIARIKKLLK
jgi:hypothetical protein